MTRGVSLIEVLLVIVIIAVLAGISVPVFLGVRDRNALDLAATTFAQTLRRAQLLSEGVEKDSSWGVRVDLGEITLFTGASFTARDHNFDEVFDIPTSITPAGLEEVVFEKLSGLPGQTGTTVFTGPANETRNVTINEKGTVEY